MLYFGVVGLLLFLVLCEIVFSHELVKHYVITDKKIIDHSKWKYILFYLDGYDNYIRKSFECSEKFYFDKKQFDTIEVREFRGGLSNILYFKKIK